MAAGWVLCVVSTLCAHRVDEYLQSNYVSVERDRIKMDLFLVPGIAVLPQVLADIDADKDGTFSSAEQRSYAARVIADLNVTVNGKRLTLRPTETTFASRAEMNEGVGGILIAVSADVPPSGMQRHLRVENRHHAAIAVYLVNCLVSGNPDIGIGREQRTTNQAVYELDYTQAEVHSGAK